MFAADAGPVRPLAAAERVRGVAATLMGSGLPDWKVVTPLIPQPEISLSGNTGNVLGRTAVLYRTADRQYS